MLQRALKAETLKLHHSPIWFAFIIIPIISAVMGTFNYCSNREILTQEWYSLWTQHTLFYCYFCFPALVGVYCAYICRLEHMNNNWKSILAAPIKPGYIYVAKLLTVMKIVGLTQILVGILFFVSGKLIGFTSSVPKELVIWLGFGLIAGSVMAAVQLALSLAIKSFAIPIGISLIGGIAGLAARTAGFGLIFPYSLFAIGMCANSPETSLECSPLIFVLMCILFIMCFELLGVKKIKRSML